MVARSDTLSLGVSARIGGWGWGYLVKVDQGEERG